MKKGNRTTGSASPTAVDRPVERAASEFAKQLFNAVLGRRGRVELASGTTHSASAGLRRNHRRRRAVKEKLCRKRWLTDTLSELLRNVREHAGGLLGGCA